MADRTSAVEAPRRSLADITLAVDTFVRVTAIEFFFFEILHLPLPEGQGAKRSYLCLLCSASVL